MPFEHMYSQPLKCVSLASTRTKYVCTPPPRLIATAAKGRERSQRREMQCLVQEAEFNGMQNFNSLFKFFKVFFASIKWDDQCTSLPGYDSVSGCMMRAVCLGQGWDSMTAGGFYSQQCSGRGRKSPRPSSLLFTIIPGKAALWW